jgi:hypothetical protein
MEIKAILLKPYRENERENFIVKYSHGLGYVIKETQEELQAWSYTQEELELQEKERIGNLFLTGADVERGIYQAIGKDFEDIIELVETLIFAEAPQVQGLDLKALKIELKANNFYRGNPYVNAVGALLGFTSEQLDKFFETKDYTYLISEPVVNNSEEVTKENPVVNEFEANEE